MQSPLRVKEGLARIDSLERAWSEEKAALQLEGERLRERLKIAEEQSKRDVAIITTLEERLKDMTPTEPNNLDDLDGEDLNDELNTSRKNLYLLTLNLANYRRLQIARLEREITAAKAEAEFNKLAAENK